MPRAAARASATATATAADADATHTTPVVRVAPQAVFGVRRQWCIVTCPVCDDDGFVQEDVHTLPAAASTCCAEGHAYNITLSL